MHTRSSNNTNNIRNQDDHDHNHNLHSDCISDYVPVQNSITNENEENVNNKTITEYVIDGLDQGSYLHHSAIVKYQVYTLLLLIFIFYLFNTFE